MTKKTVLTVALVAVGLSLALLPSWRLWILGGLGLVLLARWVSGLDRPEERSSGGKEGPATPTPAAETEALEPAVLPVEDSLDLHAFAPRDVVSAAEEYLFAAREAGFREVRIIHGKGSGFQRRRVREMLARHPAVESFTDAPPERGGWGASVVRLR